MSDKEVVSDLINISQFLQDWGSVIDPKLLNEFSGLAKDRHILNAMDIQPGMAEELKNVCRYVRT